MLEERREDGLRVGRLDVDEVVEGRIAGLHLDVHSALLGRAIPLRLLAEDDLRPAAVVDDEIDAAHEPAVDAKADEDAEPFAHDAQLAAAAVVGAQRVRDRNELGTPHDRELLQVRGRRNGVVR